MIHEKLLKSRLDRIKKFYSALPERYFTESRPLHATICRSSEPVPFAARQQAGATFVPAVEGMRWGELWDSAWLHIEDVMPEEFAGRDVVFRLNLGGEALIFDAQGVPVYSLTNTSVFQSCYRKEIYQYRACAQAGEAIDLWLELAANGLFGDEINPDAPQQHCHIAQIDHLKVCVFNRELFQLKLELEVLLGILNIERPGGDCVYGAPGVVEKGRAWMQLVTAIGNAIDVFADTPENAGKARALLAPYLARQAAASAMTAAAVGHAHIDTGWLWPVRESVRKVARTFASQLYLMDHYPDYVFGASQAQHYWFLKKYYPELFERVKQRVAEGRWELQGGMWVEADCNIINGESMVRQFLHGKNFFWKEFGFEVKNLWLPDVFGYSANLPQIIRKSSCDHFLTQKISWNQYNKFPMHAFTWHGIDGSSVLSFFPPEDNYNAQIVPDQLNYGADNLSENDVIDEFLSLYGIGDGGGGPKEEHVERALLCRDLEGSPKVRFSRADDFFRRLEGHAKDLPHWYGELYLELHRGTLTTQSRTKRNNRLAEQKLVETEFLLSLLPVAEFPREALDRCWKKLLLNQFHDIIPGSSIHQVYEVTEREHRELLAELTELQAACAKRIFAHSESDLTLVNTLSDVYTRLVALPETWQGFEVTDASGALLPVAGGMVKVAIPGQSIISLHRGKKVAPERNTTPDAQQLVLENEWIRYRFAPDGTLVEAYDKELDKNWIEPGKVGNLLTLYADNPNFFEAWDVDLAYEKMALEQVSCTKFESVGDNALFQRRKLEFRVGEHSSLEMTISLECNSKRLEFACRADWHESHRMLRVSFPTTVQTSEGAYDIQYAFVKRPTHRNTSWDWAKFETVAQRYADLSDGDSGCALLNDCKYAYKLLGGTIDLNLLRSPSYPDNQADWGQHQFTYAFLPHAGELIHSEVQQESAMLNRPVQLWEQCAVAAKTAFLCRVAEANPAVTLEVLKVAENSDKMIIRMVETHGRNSRGKFEFAHPVTLQACDLVEMHAQGEAFAVEQKLELDFTPFEIKTFYVE